MTQSLLMSRITEALQKSGGNNRKAIEQVMIWAAQDSQLLLALTRPHLNGIVAYHVDRVASGRAESSQALAKRAQKPGRAQKTVAARGEDSFGLEMLKAVSRNDGATFGLEGSGSVAAGRKVQASQQHIEAIRLLARNTPSRRD